MAAQRAARRKGEMLTGEKVSQQGVHTCEREGALACFTSSLQSVALAKGCRQVQHAACHPSGDASWQSWLQQHP